MGKSSTNAGSSIARYGMIYKDVRPIYYVHWGFPS